MEIKLLDGWLLVRRDSAVQEFKGLTGVVIDLGPRVRGITANETVLFSLAVQPLCVEADGSCIIIHERDVVAIVKSEIGLVP